MEALNISRLLANPRCAVLCDTEQEAERLLGFLRPISPNVRRSFKRRVPWLEDEPGTAYAPRLCSAERAGHASADYYRGIGYEIIPFRELMEESGHV